MNVRVLGGRYVLGDRLGGGGTAFVYKGRDSLLNRTVAIKVLNAQLTADGDFIAKFRREAQAAASLSNPYIVGIYDVGQDDDIYYIVMEYVEGKTLKEFIAQHGPISPELVVDIAMQIAEALRHAHQHGVIHRDIKPHNILITRDGQAKVTDFGLARATTTLTLTQSGSLMGSVHYMSPEQARGGYTNERSDIYSLGVVMYEMLTGVVPFTGDNVVSIGLKHLQENPRPLRELTPNIAPHLEHIVTKAMLKEQSKRYQSVTEMIRDLGHLSGIGGPPVEPSKGGRRGKEPADVPRELEDTYIPSLKVDNMSPKQRKKLPWLAMVSLSMFLAMLLVGGALLYVFWPRPEVIVPNVVGQSLAEAERLLRRDGLNPTIREAEFNAEVPPNVVIRQQPPAGRPVRAGRLVELIPSRGPELLEVPQLVGLSLLEAQLALAARGFTIGQQTAENHETAPVEQIIAQNPRPGFLTERGVPIDIVVSLGRAITEVQTPLLVGLTESEVIVALREAGLTVKMPINQEFHATVPFGKVISQLPLPGAAIAIGGEVAIVVSRGKQARVTVVIPADRLNENTRVEIIVDDREGRRVVYQDTHSRADGDLHIPVTGFAPMRLLVRINGRIDREEVID